MHLLYSGSHGCPLPTLKRLLLIADDLAFMDRPSITFAGSGPGSADAATGGWGTIGMASPLRLLVPAFNGYVPRLSVHSPPSGPAYDVYRHYIEKDLSDAEFRRLFLAGLRNESFATKFLQLEAEYTYKNPSGPGRIVKGREVANALIEDSQLQSARLVGAGLQGEPFRIVDERGRLETLRMLLIEASIQVTNAMIVADETQSIPVTDDPFVAQLMAIRVSSQSYVGGVSPIAPLLGFEIAKAVLPDEALARLDIPAIFLYRERTREAYRLWAAEINQIAAELDQLTAEEIERGIPRTIAAKVTPRLLQYRNEMQSTAERLFGDVLKTLAKWELPTLSLAYIANLSFADAIALFAAAASRNIPAVVDFFQSRRETRRKHAIAYLVDLAEEVGHHLD